MKNKTRAFSSARSSTYRTVSITGTGSYLPERILTNAELEKMVETSDEWIFSRTGMRERRIAAPEQATSDLGAVAAERALERAGVAAEDVDLIICATITPDMPFPNTACLIQHLLGARNAFCFDLEAACSGFLYALEVAGQFVASGAVDTALVLGAETLSNITDWEDRTTCVLFGDGAGAAVLQATGAEHGLMGSVMGSDGALAELLMVPGGGSRHPTSQETLDRRMQFMRMSGREVFKHAVTKMSQAARQVVKRCDMTIEDVDWVIPHQANIRIIQAIAQRLHVPMDKFVVNVGAYGNTSAASAIIAMDEAARDGRLKPHDVVMLLVFGGGFTWGAGLLEWYGS